MPAQFGFGMMRLPVLQPEDRSTVDIPQLEKMADYYLGAGFSRFDTAVPYHDKASEAAFRKAVAYRHPRDSYQLADKLSLRFINSREEMEPFFNAQLKNCGVEYFDKYLVHNMVNATYEKAQKFNAFEFVLEKRKEGLVRQAGFSFHGDHELLETILSEHPEMDFVQLQINYLDWDDPVVQSRANYEVARKHDKPVLVMEPVKGSSLFNLPENVRRLLHDANPDIPIVGWALRFAACLPGVEIVYSGMTTLEQMKENCAIMKDVQPLSDAELEALKNAARLIRENTAIPCTNCRYCEPECPQHIDIPDYFSLYNVFKRLKTISHTNNQQGYYQQLIQKHGKASDCIECGKCEKACPQHIGIRKWLKEVASVFES